MTPQGALLPGIHIPCHPHLPYFARVGLCSRVEGVVCHFQDQVVEGTICFLLIHPLAHWVSLSSLSFWGRQLSSHSRSLGNPGGKDLSEAFIQKPETNPGLLLTTMWAWNQTLQSWDTFRWLQPLRQLVIHDRGWARTIWLGCSNLPHQNCVRY